MNGLVPGGAVKVSIEIPGEGSEEGTRNAVVAELSEGRIWLRVGWSARVLMPTHWASIGLTPPNARQVGEGLLRLAAELERSP
jgi:hypothetical protein